MKLKSEQVFGKKTREKVPAVVASRAKIGYTLVKRADADVRIPTGGLKTSQY
jgi:hypothetical protein